MSHSDLPFQQRRFFRDQLREARALALKDSEGFPPIVIAIERLGSVVHPSGKNLGSYREWLLAIARKAKAAACNGDDPGMYTPLETLFAAVTKGRNDAVHEGAYARHLVRHCIELSLHIEEGLMAESSSVADFMVRSPVCAEPWQPVSLARQQMLTHSFSHLPILLEGQWRLLSDHAIASYLSESSNPREAIRVRIEDACKAGSLTLEQATVVEPGDKVRKVLNASGGRPVLVLKDGRLLGIATPFDFL